MFLSLSWCIISDIDINSEVMRCLGPLRFTLYGIYRVMNVRHYEGQLKLNGAKVSSNIQDDLDKIALNFKEIEVNQ